MVQTARDEADSEHPAQSTTTEASSERERGRADDFLEVERSKADAVLADERVERRRDPGELLANEREATNRDLTGERTYANTLIDQREANTQLISAAIRAQELTTEADAAKARAEKSELELRAVGEFREMFIGILGHDLRNPLNSIVLAAALLLRRGHLDDEDAATAARIISSSQRITRMITQTLDLTRARLGGGLPIEAKPTDLREVCRNVVDEFDATIQLEVEGDLTGTWDADRLTETLSNIAGNAIAYAAPDPFIFEPFRRAQQRAKSATGNLGLGLYIAHQIVLSHGGTLVANSADGTTTFTLRLPRVSIPPAASSARTVR